MISSPQSGGTLEQKTSLIRDVFFGGEGGIRNILQSRLERGTLGAREPPMQNASHDEAFISGGEGGIRTREPFWVTRFPSVRAKPDYATSPNQAGDILPYNTTDEVAAG